MLDEDSFLGVLRAAVVVVSEFSSIDHCLMTTFHHVLLGVMLALSAGELGDLVLERGVEVTIVLPG